MKILLVNVVDPRDSTAIPHLGLSYVASYLRSKGFNDVEIKNTPVDYEKEKADIIGLTAVSQNYTLARNEAAKAKAAGAIVVIGGVHITLLPETMDNNMDIGVVGEGEITFHEVVSTIEKHGLDVKYLDKIKGIAFWKNGKISRTKPRPLVDDLDTLPFPAGDLLEDKTMPTMVTSRGCPFKCVFCCSSKLWPRVRFHSSKYVLDEIKYLVAEGAKHITFTDDLFIADIKRLREIADGLKLEGMSDKLTFTMWCKASLIHDDTTEMLKEMNTELVSLGLESGDENVLNYAKQGSATVADNERAVNLLRDNGINVQATFVIGFPQDTRESIMKTFDHIKRSRLNSFEVYMLAPLPATPIWDIAMKKGLVSEDKDFNWSSIAHRAEYDMNEKIVLTDNLTPQELFELHKKFIWLRKKRKFRHMIKNAAHHPYRIPVYVRKKMF
ncbi:MAG: radical SAM protein [Candidatus Aenigmatarchaeota archaeon]